MGISLAKGATPQSALSGFAIHLAQHWCFEGDSLRASAGGRSAVLHSFALAKASPALVRLAEHPVSAR